MSRFVLRSIVAAAIAVFALQTPAKAATVTYNVTFNALINIGNGNGTGSFNVDAPIPALGNAFYEIGSGLNSLEFFFDGLKFDLTTLVAGPGNPQIFFQNGNLAGIIYQGLIGSASLNVGALSFVYAGTSIGIGDLSASLAPPEANPTGETPLPGAVFLFGSVLAGAAGIRKWRNRRGVAAPVAA